MKVYEVEFTKDLNFDYYRRYVYLNIRNTKYKILTWISQICFNLW
jgi:hypothetical protein